MNQRALDQWVGRRIHFIGIAGAGMSGLARIALSHGLSISGSDSKDSSVVLALRTLGAQVQIGHDAAHLDGVDIVVYSNAISESNPEIKRAQELGLPLLTRAQALATLMSAARALLWPERTVRRQLLRCSPWHFKRAEQILPLQ
jgi:UDP-N-acetylmuramate--alanine ligase